jgi:esterase/lipase
MNRYLLLLLLLINFCFANENNPLYLSSKSLPNYNQQNFSEYVNENKQWLKDNRVFLSKNQNLELSLNTPFERRPISQKVSKGILLVHGLGDSPGYFEDLTQELVSNGFLVRTVLLTGHGSKPADLINVEFKEWENLVSHHIKLLEKKVDDLWLGGFSTGANLITSYALENEKDISGLLLFSPGFASNQGTLLPLSGIGTYFKTWLFQNDNSQNILRYESLSMNASNLYYKSLQKVQEELENKSFSKPVFVTISEDDSVIKAEEIVSIFSNNFKNPNSQLL